MLVVYDEMIYHVVTMRDENGKVLAVMSNPLLRRKLSLDVMQQHIFHIAVGQIKYPRDEKAKLPVFDIRVDAYAALTGRSPRQGSLYQQLKAAVKGLQHAEVALLMRSTSRESLGSRLISMSASNPTSWASGNISLRSP
jgi:hypothetical protein